MVSIQSSHTSLSKRKCSSPFRNLMSCSLLIPWLCSLNYPSCGNINCGISCFFSLNCLSYGDVICGTIVVCLTTCTSTGISLPLLALQMVPLCPSSFFVPSNLCSHVNSSFLSLRLFPQLCSPLENIYWKICCNFLFVL